MAFGVTTCGAGEVVKAVRRVYPKTLIVKLSPNVTDITEIAKAVEVEGGILFQQLIRCLEWPSTQRNVNLYYLQ